MTEELTDRWGERVVDPFPDAGAPPPYRPRRPQRRGAGRWVVAIVSLLVLAGVLVAAPWDAGRRQTYADQWVVWTDPPSAEITQLADELALTETGRRIFFATRPQVEAARDFEEHCPFEAEVVLGCYDRGRIYVYDVTDARLAGTVEATTAHELLHAVYARLDEAQTARIDTLVAGYVATLPADDETVALVGTYPESQRADEWHSRLGTSFGALPAELERHYAQVFLDRDRILDYDSGATAQIDGYTDRIDELSASLDAASLDLAARSAAYDADLAALNADIDDFNARADAGDFASQDDFTRERAAILERQNALEAQRLALNADVDSYNATLAELQTLDAERAELYGHLDSHSAP